SRLGSFCRVRVALGTAKLYKETRPPTPWHSRVADKGHQKKVLSCLTPISLEVRVRNQDESRRAYQMRSLRLLSVSVVILLLAMIGGPAGFKPQGAAPQAAPAAAKPMTMTVSGFGDGSDIPAKYTQAGDQTSPAISWNTVPAGTVTFVLSM